MVNIKISNLIVTEKEKEFIQKLHIIWTRLTINVIVLSKDILQLKLFHHKPLNKFHYDYISITFHNFFQNLFKWKIE